MPSKKILVKSKVSSKKHPSKKSSKAKESPVKAALVTDEAAVNHLVAIFWAQFEKKAKRTVDYDCFNVAIEKGALQNIRNNVDKLYDFSGEDFRFAKKCCADAGTRAFNRSTLTKEKTITKTNFETSYDEGVLILDKLNKRRLKQNRPKIIGAIC